MYVVFQFAPTSYILNLLPPSSIHQPSKMSTTLASTSTSDVIMKSSSSHGSHASSRSSCLTSSSGGSSSEDDDARFQPLQDAINHDALAEAALAVRHRQQPHLPDISCSVLPEPKCGSFNATFFATFSDGLRWIARFPGAGVSSWGDLRAPLMVSEGRAKNFIRSLGLPVPEVFSLEPRQENPVGAPYTLEACAKGKLLSELWDDASEDFRIRVLQHLARTMVPLRDLRFDKIGMAEVDDDGRVLGIVNTIDLTEDINEAMMSPDGYWGDIKVSKPYDTANAKLLDYIDEPVEEQPPDTVEGECDQMVLEKA